MNIRTVVYSFDILMISLSLVSCNISSYMNTNLGLITVPEEGSINFVKITENADFSRICI